MKILEIMSTWKRRFIWVIHGYLIAGSKVAHIEFRTEIDNSPSLCCNRLTRITSLSIVVVYTPTTQKPKTNLVPTSVSALHKQRKNMVFSSSRSIAVLLLSTAANLVVAETYLKEQFNDAVSRVRFMY